MIKKMVPVTVNTVTTKRKTYCMVHTDSTLFPNGLDENGLATTDEQVSLHLTASGRAHEIIPEGCWSGNGPMAVLKLTAATSVTLY